MTAVYSSLHYFILYCLRSWYSSLKGWGVATIWHVEGNIREMSLPDRVFILGGRRMEKERGVPSISWENIWVFALTRSWEERSDTHPALCHHSHRQAHSNSTGPLLGIHRTANVTHTDTLCMTPSLDHWAPTEHRETIRLRGNSHTIHSTLNMWLFRKKKQYYE